MRISRVQMTNHRSIHDLDVEVRDHLVLVGPNASGKTTLLRCLDAALSGSVAQLWRQFSADSFRSADQDLVIDVTFDGFSVDEGAVLADEITVPPVEARDRPHLRLNVTASLDGDDLEVKRHFMKPEGARRVRADHLDAIGWSLLSATRSPERELGRSGRSAMRSLLDSLDLGDVAGVVQELLSEANDAVDGAPATVALRAELARELSDVFPSRVDAADLKVVVSTDPEGGALSHGEVHIGSTEGPIAPLHQQSDGLRSLATIVVQRLARSAPLLAVDEPEIHLHPRSQARVARLLASGPGQRLVATHSAAVVAAFPPSDLVVLAPQGVRQLPAGRIQGDPNFFAQWWTDATVEPLTARRVVLVEGPSDRILLARVGVLLERDLDHLDTSVVVVNGATSFKTLLKLFGTEGFGLNVGGLVDEAEIPIVATALGVAAPQLEAAGFLVSRPDLEAECVDGLGVERHVALLEASGLYSARTILGRFHVDDANEIDPGSYAEWCRDDKLRVAAALAKVMTPADAARITSLVAVLDRVAIP